tara:strand:+ start:337 stop:558 length:222 start_codon:yes stop_codon:yes gene_type:complete
MRVDWSVKMSIGDLIMFDDDFYKSMSSAGIGIEKIGIIVEVKEMFYCIKSGEVDDLWVSVPDIKKINLDKYAK